MRTELEQVLARIHMAVSYTHLPGDHGTVIAHRTGDRDLVALAALVKLDGHIFHLEAAVGQLEACLLYTSRCV